MGKVGLVEMGPNNNGQVKSYGYHKKMGTEGDEFVSSLIFGKMLSKLGRWCILHIQRGQEVNTAHTESYHGVAVGVGKSTNPLVAKAKSGPSR